MVFLAAKAPITQAAILFGLLRALKRPGYGRLYNALKHVMTLDGKWPVVIKYARIEARPPTVTQLTQLGPKIGEVFQGVANIHNYTLAQIAVRALIVWEIAMWYYVGEIIGRGNIRGYVSRFPYVMKESEMFHKVGSRYQEALANL